MVTLNTIQCNRQNGHIVPVMHVHKLRCIKSAPTFDEGEMTECYITKNDNGRYAVFTTSGVKKTKYHVFQSENDLHEHFEEL